MATAKVTKVINKTKQRWEIVVTITRMKHLDLRFHWLRDTIEAGHISPIHIPTTLQAADIFTKPLKHQKIDICLDLLGLCYVALRDAEECYSEIASE